MNQPLLSVIMSIYNGEKYLSEAIESILNQTYRNFEFIIVNDGSNDSSLKIIKKFMKKDKRIILINRENKGLTYSLNECINKSTGEYIARIDGDDISMPKRFENFIRFIQKNNNVTIYTTPAIIINQDGEKQKLYPNYFRRHGFHPKMLNYYNSLIHGTLIIKSNIIKKFKYDEDFKYSQDFELYHRLIKYGYHIYYDKNNISYKLRIHSSQVSSLNESIQFELYMKILKKYNIKYYKHTLINRLFIKLIDIIFYIKINFIRENNYENEYCNYIDKNK